MNEALTGRTIAAYRVERLLGQGGMASVYFAWDTRHDRPVALKVLDGRYQDVQSSIDRFVQEAQVIAAWDHAHIVHVYDAGQDQGIYYYAMEFIRGLDLAQLLRQYVDAGQLLPYDEVIRIGWAVASALDFAHQHGIIHRDVKPSNVLVSVDGRILLSDFGLVMDLARGTLGETFGSPHYIAPEQARNSAAAVPQSDIYALGVILYEMLTGVVPFHDPSPAALALKHLTEPPPAPRALNPRLNPGIEAVLLRALRKSPRERYATGRELMTALERSLSSELADPSATAPIPALDETEQARRRIGQTAVMDAHPPAPGWQGTAVYPSPDVNPPAGGEGRYPPTGANLPVGGAAGYTPTGANPPVGGGAGFNRNPPPAIPPPRENAPRSGGRGRSLGCVAALAAAALLSLVVFVVLVLKGMNPPAIGALASPTPTDFPTLTVTPQTIPTLTQTATVETPTPTTSPTLTFTPTQPTPTETIAPPTETPSPTPTPEPDLVFIHVDDRGLVIYNPGPQPFPIASIEIWDNDVELTGDEFDIETLDPGECVLVWENNGDPRLPEGLACEQVGEIPERQGRMKFWTRTMNFLFNGVKIAECPAREERCEVDFP